MRTALLRPYFLRFFQPSTGLMVVPWLFISKRRRLLLRLCYWGKSLNSAREVRLQVRSKRFWAWLHKPPVLFKVTGRRKTFRLKPLRPGTVFAFAPATKFRSMESFSKDEVP